MVRSIILDRKLISVCLPYLKSLTSYLTRLLTRLRTCASCLKPISALASPRPRSSHPYPEGCTTHYFIYPPLLSQSQEAVVGGLWDCQTAVNKVDFISVLASHYSLDFLALPETWISPQNSAMLDALSFSFCFFPTSHEKLGGVVVQVPYQLSWCITHLLCLI